MPFCLDFDWEFHSQIIGSADWLGLCPIISSACNFCWFVVKFVANKVEIYWAVLYNGLQVM